MSDTVTGIIGYILFALSEILPFVNIRTNGFLHTLILGFTNSFLDQDQEKAKIKDIEMGNVLIEKNLYKKLSANPQVKSIIDTLINDTTLLNTLYSILDDNSLYLQLQKLINNTQLQSILNILINDQVLSNNISSLSPNTLKLLTPQNTSLLNKLSKDVKTSNIIDNVLAIDPTQKEHILNIVAILKSHPEIISDINDHVNKSIM
jgi:hypothetical protein